MLQIIQTTIGLLLFIATNFQCTGWVFYGNYYFFKFECLFTAQHSMETKFKKCNLRIFHHSGNTSFYLLEMCIKIGKNTIFQCFNLNVEIILEKIQIKKTWIWIINVKISEICNQFIFMSLNCHRNYNFWYLLYVLKRSKKIWEKICFDLPTFTSKIYSYPIYFYVLFSAFHFALLIVCLHLFSNNYILIFLQNTIQNLKSSFFKNEICFTNIFFIIVMNWDTRFTRELQTQAIRCIQFTKRYALIMMLNEH